MTRDSLRQIVKTAHDERTSGWTTNAASVMILLFAIGAGWAVGSEAPSRFVTATVVAQAPDGSKVSLVDFATLGFYAMAERKAAKDQPEYSFLMLVPGWYSVGFEHEDSSEDETGSLFHATGVEGARLEFTMDGPLVFVNRQPYSVDFNQSGAIDWLKSRTDAELSPIKAITLSGKGDDDRIILERFARTGVAVVLSEKQDDWYHAARSALASVQPCALFNATPDAIGRWLGDLKQLTLLDWKGEALPDIRGLKRLREIMLTTDGESLDLTPLRHAPALRGLAVHGEKLRQIAGLEQLARFRRLEWLILSGDVDWGQLDILRKMKDLRVLTILGGRYADLRMLEKLEHLTVLCLSDIPKTIDLRPIERLRSLRVLVLDSDAIEKNTDFLDALKKQRDGLRVLEGFCLGSAAIVPIVLLGLTGAMLGRRLVSGRRRSVVASR